MPIALTPQTLYELVLLSCIWDWNTAAEKADKVRQTDPKSHATPFRFYGTTVDKVIRVLRGLGIVTDAQIASVRTDLATLNYFYRNVGLRHHSDIGRFDLVSAKERMITVADMRKPPKKTRYLRNMILMPTSIAHVEAEALANKYGSHLNREAYYSELERQRDAFESRPKAGKAAIAKRYRQRVEEET